jgi:hypothetical protein
VWDRCPRNEAFFGRRNLVIHLYPIVRFDYATKPAGRSFRFRGTLNPGSGTPKRKLLHALLYDTTDLAHPMAQSIQVDSSNNWEVTLPLTPGKSYVFVVCASEGNDLAKEVVFEFTAS